MTSPFPRTLATCTGPSITTDTARPARLIDSASRHVMQATPRQPAWRLSAQSAFYVMASITVSFLAGSLAPTPLYPVYQAEWGLSSLTITLVFGIYALALLASLLITGRLSDHIGRRPVLITATVVQALNMLIFANASSLDWLLTARVIQGLATGAAVAAVGAGLIDLNKTRGPIANAVAPPLGTALGGLMGGLMVHFLPAPTTLVYLVLAGIFVLQTFGVLFMDETVEPRAGALASLRPQISLPSAARRPMLLAIPILVAVWSLAGFYGSLVPAILRATFGLNASLAGGIAAFVLAGSAAAAVLALQHLSPRQLLLSGAIGLSIGTGLVVLALTWQSAAGFYLATLLAGIGFGAGFQGAVRSVMPTAKPHERAGVLSVIFVVSYLAMGIPAVSAGLLVAWQGNLLVTAQEFGGVVVGLAALALAGLLTRAQRPTPVLG